MFNSSLGDVSMDKESPELPPPRNQTIPCRTAVYLEVPAREDLRRIPRRIADPCQVA